MKWQIFKIKWESQQTKDDIVLGIGRPRWIQEILDNKYDCYDDCLFEAKKLAKYYSKPISHFQINCVYTY